MHMGVQTGEFYPLSKTRSGAAGPTAKHNVVKMYPRSDDFIHTLHVAERPKYIASTWGGLRPKGTVYQILILPRFKSVA